MEENRPGGPGRLPARGHPAHSHSAAKSNAPPTLACTIRLKNANRTGPRTAQKIPRRTESCPEWTSKTGAELLSVNAIV